MPISPQISITRGLILSFSVLISIFLFFSLYTFYNIGSILRLTRTIYDHPLAVSNAALQANVSITKMHYHMKDVVLFESPIRILKSIEAVKQEEKKVYQHLDIVKARILGAQGQNLEAQARELFEEWRPIREEVIELTRAGHRNRAADITIGEGADHVAALETKMMGLTNYARAKAGHFLAETVKHRSSTRISSLLFLVASFLAAALIIAFTLRRTAAAETALRESKQLLTNAIDRAPIGMVMVSPKGYFLQANNAYSEMVGYSEAELKEMHFQEVTHPDDADIDPTTIHQLMQGEVNGDRLEKRYIRKDGSTIHVQLTTSLVTDQQGQPLFFFTQAQDITERKSSENKLRASEQRFRELFDNMGTSVAICDSPDGGERFIFRDMNQSGLTLTQMAKDRILGHDVREILPGIAKTGLLALFTDVWRNNTAARQATTHYAHGALEFWIETFVFKLPSGELVAIFEDRTDQHKAAREKEQLERQLFHTQKLESVGTLAGGIAHDFNNILASIIGFTELALDDVEKGSQLEGSLMEIYTAGKRARDLVKQILAFARQSGEERKPVLVGTIAKEALKLIRSTTPTSIEMEQHITSNALVMANPAQIHQVLMNLCTNAAHALENEEGCVKVVLEDVSLDGGEPGSLNEMAPGNYIKLSVSDNGVGIAPEIQDSIFEPYFTTKGPGKGTGMGLAMVDGIVASYGGKIMVSSKPGQGSEFNVYLPITERQVDRLPEQMQNLPTGSERILIVDDELAVAKLCSQLLDRLGYSVSFRTSSYEALELVRMRPTEFDLVISDMTMPNMTGDKLAIAMMEIRPDLPVIICTGYSNRISEAMAAKIGIRGFAYKPVVKADLAKLVRRVLDETQPLDTAPEPEEIVTPHAAT
jgi:PAS domain S-box-containing protein